MYLQPKFGKQKLLHTYGGTMNIKRLEQIILSPFKLQTLYVAHFWLHHTAHCTEKILSAHLHTGSVSPESGAGRGGAGGGGTGRDGD